MVIDAAHALAPHGVDKFKRKHKPKLSEEARLKKLMARDEQQQREMDIILQKTSFRDQELDNETEHDEDEENILYFIMKNAPTLEQWKREIIRIVYKVNQYFYPQGQTQVLNEGFASFTHYYIMTRLEEKGILSPDAYIAFLDSHAGVLYQPSYNSRHYSGGFNPYALGFAILMDLKRICTDPTDEDREWFPHLIGRRWQEVIQEATFEHRDDSFIMQYLSPKVIRDLKLFSVNVKYGADNEPVDDDGNNVKAYVSEIHDEVGYKQLRLNLARSYDRQNRVPQIIVRGADLEGDRTLYLEYVPYMGRKLDRESAEQVADYIDYLWNYPVEIDDGEPD
jgi:spore cortex formation protein SpoVR/YcgB (stage V sporulation)